MIGRNIQYFVAGVFVGVLFTVGIGFGWLGWVLPGKAERMAQQAVVSQLVPICVAQFEHDPHRAEKMKKLQGIQYPQQSAYVERQGWATMPGAKKPNPDVANQCVQQLSYAQPVATRG